MPLVRVQVRNEYGLGHPELYGEGRSEDPKAVLEGVAVAGFVGILRQLGDLAGFAEEVFNGIQEEVANTSLRSHKLVARLQRIETALAPVEKVILAQKNHLHFAYTPGCFYHSRLQNEQNHFIDSEWPQFIGEYYEECSVPPCLQLLDKFDTGGSGSCLKRYSDPSFFSRASASSSEGNVNQVSKEKEARGSKENIKNKQKKRTRKRNHVSHAASVSKQHDRINIDSLKVEEQISPQTVSTSDVALKSDLEDQSDSLHSRTNSGFIECIFRSKYSTGLEEEEVKQSCVWNLSMGENNTLDSASVDEHVEVLDYDSPGSLVKEQVCTSSLMNHNEDDERVELLDSGFPHSSPQDPTGPISPSVTWDEKKEIVEPVCNRYYPSETAVTSEMNIDWDTQENEALTVIFVDEKDSNEGMAVSASSKIEPDNSTDTLKTVVPDPKSDSDFQIKQEVEQLFNYNDIGLEEGMHLLTEHPPDLQPWNLECNTVLRSSSDVLTSCDESKAISSECYAEEESIDMMKGPPVNSNNSGMHLGGNKENPIMVSDLSHITDLGTRQASPKVPVNVKVIDSTCESQKFTSKISGGQSVTFWTNGSLLGLEPSKPPVFSESNAVCHNSVTRSTNDSVVLSTASNIFNGDIGAEKLDISVESSECVKQALFKNSSAGHADQHTNSSEKTTEFLPAELHAKCNKYGQVYPCNIFGDDHEHSLRSTSKVVPESWQPVNPDLKATSVEATQEGGEIATSIFGNRFLNNFQREVSVAHDATSELHSSRKNGFFEQKTTDRSDAYHTIPERTFKGCLPAGSTLMSPSSSPPLQHVKISFQPGTGVETSNLKLKFSDGSCRNESCRDVLPSFQLVHEPSTPHDVNSDSDDDTFCRSSPYLSDDCLSHQSDLNSEVWESDDTPSRKDKALPDALSRISLSESASRTMELGGPGHGNFYIEHGLLCPKVETCPEPHQSTHWCDLPNFSTLNPLFELDVKDVSNANESE